MKENNSTAQQAAESIDKKAREQLYMAAINCGHEIDEDTVVIYRDPKIEGNALSQLADRLSAAFPATSHEGKVDTCAEMRALCSACGGTGDVHGLDGEWRGSCDCEASAWSRAPVRSKTPADEQPVAWAVLADNGNCRIWFSMPEPAINWARVNDAKLTPLYTRPAPTVSSSAAPSEPDAWMKANSSETTSNEHKKWMENAGFGVWTDAASQYTRPLYFATPSVKAVAAGQEQAVVYPPDGTVSPFTVVNLGSGKVKIGDSLHDRRLPALWFGKNGTGMGDEEIMNREAKDGETLAVVTFSNVEGLDVLLEVIERIRRVSFSDAADRASVAAPPAAIPAPMTDAEIRIVYAAEIGFPAGSDDITFARAIERHLSGDTAAQGGE